MSYSDIKIIIFSESDIFLVKILYCEISNRFEDVIVSLTSHFNISHTY